ncbi:MAG: hypothetical protein RQ732_06275, partial [Methylophaga sp.]|nr:hypothetical protein [Methylophaga sp.]
AVVTKNVPPYAIVAGNPAKLIRFRFNEETISQLLKINWWYAPFEYLCQLDFSDIQAVIASLERYEKFKPEYLTIRGKKIIKTREKL